MATRIEVNGKLHRVDCTCKICRIERGKAAKVVVLHGTRAGWKAGCQCDECKDYGRMTKRNDRVTTPGRSTANLHVVVDGVPQDNSEPEGSRIIGVNEQGIIDECAKLTAAQERPGSVTMARTLARILDNEDAMSLWPTTTRQLTAILSDMRGSSKKQARGRLAQVKKMTTSTKAG